MFENIFARHGLIDYLGEKLVSITGFLLVFFPLFILAVLMAVNGFKGQETTFSIRSEEFMALLSPVFFLVFWHIVRFATVLMHRASVTFRADKGVDEPRNSSIALGSMSLPIMLAYGFVFTIWFFFFKHTDKASYWLFAVLLSFTLITHVMMKYEFLYGFKKADQTMVRANEGNADQSQSAPQNVARKQKATLAFKDVYGNTDIKRRLLDAGRAITAPRKEGQAPRNGILLHGEPGNGKNVFAEALAGELNLPFLQLTHSDVASQWVGERTVKIKAAFDQAIRNQPCVMFIDEIDSFIPDRSNSMSSSNKEDADVVNTLLTLLVDIRKSKVVVIAATNYMDRLDSAAVREGRFDFKVEITPPDEEARIGLLRSGLKTNMPKANVSDDVLKNVAQRWNGFSVKRILAVTEELPSYLADLEEKGSKPSSLSFDDFMAALRRIQGRKGATPENVKRMDELVLPAQTKEALAMIASRLADPVRVERLGGTLPSGVLFYGPPGTGKTAACKALAKEVGSAFLTSTGADLARDSKALEKIYAQAKELRPSIIFIDEADDLLRSREYSANSEATNKLLTLMDGVTDRVRDIIWVAATNHPDQIDAALLRGGRFTEKVEFVRPDSNQLVKHIDGWLAKRKIDLSAGLNAQAIADMIGVESIANAEAVLQHAVNRAISQTTGDSIRISADDVQVGISTVLGGVA